MFLYNIERVVHKLRIMEFIEEIYLLNIALA